MEYQVLVERTDLLQFISLSYTCVSNQKDLFAIYHSYKCVQQSHTVSQSFLTTFPQMTTCTSLSRFDSDLEIKSRSQKFLRESGAEYL